MLGMGVGVMVIRFYDSKKSASKEERKLVLFMYYYERGREGRESSRQKIPMWASRVFCSRAAVYSDYLSWNQRS